MLSNGNIYLFIYIYVKTEQAGNQASILNGSLITKVTIVFGVSLSLLHWAWVWFSTPMRNPRFVQLCEQPNEAYIPYIKGLTNSNFRMPL